MFVLTCLRIIALLVSQKRHHFALIDALEVVTFIVVVTGGVDRRLVFRQPASIGRRWASMRRMASARAAVSCRCSSRSSSMSAALRSGNRNNDQTRPHRRPSR